MGSSYREGQEVPSGPLYRRIFPDPSYYKPPPEDRATSLNFLPDRGDEYVSMFLAAEVTLSEVLDGHERFGLLEINAEILWGLGCRVTYEPKYGKGHVGVWRFTKRDDQRRRNAAIAARVLVRPKSSL